MATQVFDVHVHYGAWRRIEDRKEARNFLPRLVDAMTEAGVARAALIGWPGGGNELVQEALERHPDRFVGLAMIRMDEDPPSVVDEFYHRGFAGLKLINPSKNYDDPAYYPLYERAEAREMRLLFHTGVIGGPRDYLLGGKEDPWKQPPEPGSPDEESLIAELERHARTRPYGVSSARMQPVYLDAIAIRFPGLYIIGAHLGWPEYIMACAIARWRPRVYFDISGGEVVRRHILSGGFIGREISPTKLVYGSDCDLSRLKGDVEAWRKGLRELGLSEADQRRIFWDNAASIFQLR